MMLPSASTLLDRLAAARQRRLDGLAANLPAPPTAASRLGSAYAIGDRVFDLVTGDHGRITRVDAGATPGSTEMIVSLDAGPLVTRAPSQIIDRPSER
jgi:hypothetical protein